MAAMVTWAEVSKLAASDWWKEAEWRVEAERFVAEVDGDGDGKVWLKEIAQSELGMEAGEEAVVRAFTSLDADKQRGWLDPSQCTALFFLFTHHRRACHSCHKLLLPGAAFTCTACLPIAHSSNSPPFSLCSTCLSPPPDSDSSAAAAAAAAADDAASLSSSGSAPHRPAAPRHHNLPPHHSFNSISSTSSIPYSHHHPRHLFLHDLLLFRKLLSHPPSATASSSAPPADPPPFKVVDQTIKQCCICGDFHEPNVKGLMGPFHMAKMKDSPNEYVCEWCFSYFCSKCGQRIRDSTTRAEPGKWLQKYICPGCHTNMATIDKYDIYLQRMKQELTNSELLKNCKTCEIKHRQGILTGSVPGRTGARNMGGVGNPSLNLERNMGSGMNPNLNFERSMGGGANPNLNLERSMGGGVNHNMNLERNMGGGVNHNINSAAGANLRVDGVAGGRAPVNHLNPASRYNVVPYAQDSISRERLAARMADHELNIPTGGNHPRAFQQIGSPFDPASQINDLRLVPR